VNAHADYVFTIVDCAGEPGSAFASLNNVGGVIGYTTGGPFVGTLQSDGTLACTLLPLAPGGYSPDPRGINDSGAIVGDVLSPDGATIVGFILNGSTYTYLSHPGFDNTVAYGINAAGLVVGTASNNGASGGSVPVGGVAFVFDPTTGVYTDFSDPGTRGTSARAIDTMGRIVGDVRIPGLGVQGFLRDPSNGKFTAYAIPHYTDPSSGFSDTRTRGVDDAGLIAGWGTDLSTGNISGWVGNPTNGFQSLTATGFDPATTTTYFQGINNRGQIIGSVGGIDGSWSHGFIVSPDAATQIANLIASLGNLNLQQGGTASSLTSKLQHALGELGNGNPNSCKLLNAFVNQVQALSGKQLTSAEAASLISSANQIRAAEGCPLN